MSFALRKSTAGQVVQFKMVDSATALKKSGLTIANTDIKLVFEAGTTQTSKNSGGATEIGSTGVYYMTLDATDTATLGKLRIDIEVAGALPWFGDYMIQTALTWDAFFAASGGSIFADIQTIKTQTVTCAAGVTVNVNVGTTQPVNFTGTSSSALVKGDTVDFGGAAGTFSSGKPAVTLASTDVTGNVAADLQTIKGQTVTCPAGVAVGAFVGNATAALGVTAAGRVDLGLWLGTAPLTLSSQQVQAIVPDGQKVDVNTIKTGAVVNSGTVTFPTNATLASTANITGGTITTVTNLTNAPTAGDFTSTMKTSLTTVIWDGLISGHTASGTFGGALNSAGGAGDPWSTTLPGAYAAGTAGFIVGTRLDAAITSRSTLTAAQAATGVWQDATPGDFTVTGSIGKSLFTSGNAPGASSGLALVGSNVGTATGVSGAVGSVTGNVGGNVVGSVGSVTAGVSVTTNADKTGYSLIGSYDFAKGTIAMTEDYAANGVAPSPVQAIFAIHQYLQQFSIASTAYTVKKLNNSTTAFIVTLNDATTPTGAART